MAALVSITEPTKRARAVGDGPLQDVYKRQVLEFLLEHDGCMQKEIAHACSVEAASVTSLLNKMERDGLVQRKIPQDNRRVSQVWLTEAGRQKAQMVRVTFTKLEERLFKGFTSRERQSLLDMLQRIQENLKEDGSRE